MVDDDEGDGRNGRRWWSKTEKELRWGLGRAFGVLSSKRGQREWGIRGGRRSHDPKVGGEKVGGVFLFLFFLYFSMLGSLF